MSKHTPGPWVVERWQVKHGGCYGWSIRPVRHDTGAVTGHQIACQYECPGIENFNLPNDGSTDEANLRLIAAAPDLLAALEKCLSAMSMQEGRQSEEFHIPPQTASSIWFGAKDEAIAALKKAEGC